MLKIATLSLHIDDVLSLLTAVSRWCSSTSSSGSCRDRGARETTGESHKDVKRYPSSASAGHNLAYVVHDGTHNTRTISYHGISGSSHKERTDRYCVR